MEDFQMLDVAHFAEADLYRLKLSSNTLNSKYKLRSDKLKYLKHRPVSNEIDVLWKVVAIDGFACTALHQLKLVETGEYEVKVELVNAVNFSIC